MSWFTLPEWLCNPWSTTAWNKWGMEVEQVTKDGRYRNRDFDDNLQPLPWQPGPHPIAQKLRDEGKLETDNFRSRYTWSEKKQSQTHQQPD